MRVLLGLVCLLAVVTSASAECAWVLWTEADQKILNPDDPKYASNKDYPQWEFDHNVRDTRAACEAALSQRMATTVKIFTSAGAKLFQPPGEAPDFFIRLAERTVTIHKRNVYLLVYQHACLPDTIDPRGPKGK